MAIKLSTTLKDAVINQTVLFLAGTTGTAGTAEVRIYSGSQPADADATPTGTLLCTISNFGFDASTGGTAGMSGEASILGTAVADGTAGWACMRTVGAAGTYRIDGSVSTAATADFKIDNVNVSSGGTVELFGVIR